MSMQPSEPQKKWTRSYPPLALVGVALLVAVLVLPSSLNLPQSTPATVLEYAPVPPEDDEPPPPNDGNLSSLGLGTSGTVAQPPPPPPPIDEGLAGRPLQARCVGKPPRQTEDPASPPCVPFFEGDNFGATYQGVTGKEIVVMVYFDEGGYGLTGQLEGSPEAGTYVDIDQPRLPNCPPDQGQTNSDPKQCDHVLVRMMKGFSRYFNSRFQLYKRRVHFWAYFTAADTAAERRGDAVANWEKLKPFAVLDEATFNGFNAEYQTAMAQLGVLSFASTQGALPAAFYRKVAPLAWGFYPDVEHWSELYSSYVCQKVKPYPVRRYNQGSGPQNGQPRKYGMWWANDPSNPDLKLFADLTKAHLRKCGMKWVEATFSKSGFAVDGTDTGTEGTQGVAQFSSQNVTTVLYMGGVETRFTTAADAARYYPEIVFAGDLDVDSTAIGRLQNQNVWRNAWGQTFNIRINRFEDSPGYRAYKEGDPAGDDNAAVNARDTYRDVFMLYQAIQVAGPRLTPQSIDEGFHAIPEKASVDPYVAAFFFDAGDYTSVKDAAEEWWDPNGRPESGGGAQPGCYRMINEGKRYLAGKWGGKDDAFKNPDDPCTAYGGAFRLRA